MNDSGGMQVEIRGRHFPVSQTLRRHIERQLHFALERFAGRVRRVHVDVGDLNGPRGGFDKQCQLAIVLAPSSVVVMKGRAANVYAAVNRAAGKAGRYIRRHLKRAHGPNSPRRIATLVTQKEPQRMAVVAGVPQGKSSS